MKKNYSTPVTHVTEHSVNVNTICTSGKSGHHGWGPNKHDNGLIDGHDIPPGQQKKTFYNGYYSAAW